MLTYILEVSICWGVFYLLYALLLSKETFFHFNRWYLLTTFVLSLAIPKVEWRLPEPVAESEIATVYFQPITVGMETLEVTVTATPVASGVDFMDVLRWIYLAGVAFFTLRFFIGLWQITRLYRRGEKRWTTFYELVLSQKTHQPFSFFNRLFMSKLIPLSPEEEKQIVQHELAHIRGLHSADVIILEIIGILFWCTPLVYFYRRSLCNVHEYIADAVVLRTSKKKQYGHLLIRQSQSGPQVALANHFHSQLKKRILMMMRNKSKRQAMLKYLLAIPLTLGVMLLFSNADAQESLQKQAEALEQAFTDAGGVLKLTSENGTITLKTEKGVDVKGDTIPWSTESVLPLSERPTYEIHYPNGTIETTMDSDFIGNEINPNDIEKIDVYRPDNLVKIWMKGSKAAWYERRQEMLRATGSKLSVGISSDNFIELVVLDNAFPKLEEPNFEIVYPDGELLSLSGQEIGFEHGRADLKPYLRNGTLKVETVTNNGKEGYIRIRVVENQSQTLENEEDYTIELIYKNGKVVRFKQSSGSDITDFVNLDDIESVSVSRKPEPLIKVYLKIDLKKDNNAQIDNEIFKTVDEMPRFPADCEDATSDQALKQCADRAMLEFIYSSIKYPAAARNVGVEGTVVAKYTIDANGAVVNPSIERGIGSGCDEEVLRILKAMPRWTSAQKDGKAVAVEMVLPVRFKLADEHEENVESDHSMVIDAENQQLSYSKNETVHVTGYGDHSGGKKINSEQDGATLEETVVVGYGNKKKTPANGDVFKVVEQMPRFPAACPDAHSDQALKACADRAMLEFIYRNIKYPQTARDNNTEGMVVVSFIVEKDGSTSNAKIARDIGDGCGVEAVRVVELMQKQNIRWAPGRQRGKPVRVQFNLPVRFKLEQPTTAKPKSDTDAKAEFIAPSPTLQLQQFQANPNPTNGLLNVSFQAEPKPTRVQVFDANGKVVHHEMLQNFTGNYQNTFDFGNLPKGILYVIIRQQERQFVRKVVLQ